MIEFSNRKHLESCLAHSRDHKGMCSEDGGGSDIKTFEIFSGIYVN